MLCEIYFQLLRSEVSPDQSQLRNFKASIQVCAMCIQDVPKKRNDFKYTYALLILPFLSELLPEKLNVKVKRRVSRSQRNIQRSENDH